MAFDLFISYAYGDNERGQVRELATFIAERFQALTGRKVEIFLGQSAIATMADWERKIDEGLRDSRLFLAVLSPNYLRSPFCRRELVEYVRYEAMRQCLGEGVAPVHFVEVSPSAEPQAAAQDWMAELHKRQWCDLRSWPAKGRRALEDAGVAARLDDLVRSLGDSLARSDRGRASPTNLPRHNPQFVGRVQELTQLRDALTRGGSVGVLGNTGGAQAGSATAVHGVGGLGKTELALAYAHAFAWDYPGGRWFLPCDGLANLDLALAKLCGAFGLELSEVEMRDPAAVADRVIAELRKRGRVLLLLDNVSHPELIAPHALMRMPEPTQVHLVVTTRLGPAQIAGSSKDHYFVAVDELPIDDSIALLRSHQPSGVFDDLAEATAAQELAKMLGGFTLAVETAAIYLGRHAAPGAIRSYVDRLAPDLLPGSEEMARDPSVAVRHRERLLERTLAITLDALSDVQRRILLLAALMPADQIALPWINQLLSFEWPDLLDRIVGIKTRWRVIIEELFALRLLHPTGEFNELRGPLLVRTHRMIQEVIRVRSNPDELAACSEKLDELLVVKALRIKDEWPEVRTRWQLLPLTAMATAKLQRRDVDGGIQLVECLHDALWQLARLTECRDLLARAMEAVSGDVNGMVQLSGAMGRVLRSLGEYREAIDVTQAALGPLRSLSGDHRHGVAGMLNNLGRLELDQGDRKSALAHLEEARSLMSALAPTTGAHAEMRIGLTKRILANLADLHRKEGNASEARRLLALRSEQRHVSSDANINDIIDDITALQLLAELERNAGNAEACRDVLSEAIGKSEALFPEAHLTRVWLRSDLADLYLENGDFGGDTETPLRLLDEALAIAETAVGPHSSRIVPHLSRLSLVSDRQKDWDRSRALHTRCLVILERLHGLTHPLVLKRVRLIGLLESGRGNYLEAQKLFARVISATLAAGPPANPEDLYDSFRAKGGVDSALKDWTSYAQTLEQGVKVIASAFGPEDQRVDEFAVKLFGLGLQEIARGNRAEGERMARVGRTHVANAGAPAHILLSLHETLSKALGSPSGNVTAEAEPEAQATTGSYAGKDYSDGDRAERRGVELYQSDRMHVALASFVEASEIFRHLHAAKPEDEEVQYRFASALNNRSIALFQLDQLEDAKPVIDQALPVFKALWARNQRRPEFGNDLAATFNNLGRLLMEMGQTGTAEQAFLESSQIRAEVLAKHPDDEKALVGLVDTEANLERLRRRLGRTRQSLNASEKKGQSQAIRSEEASDKATGWTPYPPNWHDIVKTAKSLYDAGRYLDVLDHLEPIRKRFEPVVRAKALSLPQRIVINSDMAALLHLMSRAYERLGQVEKAYQYLQRIPKLYAGAARQAGGETKQAMLQERHSAKADIAEFEKRNRTRLRNAARPILPWWKRLLWRLRGS